MRPDRVDLALRKQAVPYREMGDGAIEAGLRRPADAQGSGARLRLHLKFGKFVFVLRYALRFDVLFPQDRARRLIVSRDPRLRLPDEKQPLSDSDRRRVGGDAELNLFDWSRCAVIASAAKRSRAMTAPSVIHCACRRRDGSRRRPPDGFVASLPRNEARLLRPGLMISLETQAVRQLSIVSLSRGLRAYIAIS